MRIEQSLVVICRDLEKLKLFVEESYPHKNLRLFTPEDFLLKDAKDIIKEAYIAESEQKVIAVISKSYGVEAQNSLLKIIEEPPRNITFLLCAPSKTIFLPTIRSRLPIKIIDERKERVVSGLDFKKMSLNEMFDFLSDKRYIEKEKTKDLLQSILNDALEQGVTFSSNELEQFCRLLYLAELNTPRRYLLLSALLCIYERRHK